MLEKIKQNKELQHDLFMFSKYRNLLRELIRKNVQLKYRESWLGIFWSFLQPLLNMIVLSVVFGGMFGNRGDEVICFPVYLFTGRLIFDFFSSSTKKALRSFRENAAIIKKVYVPKYMYPLSGIFSSFVTFAISMICLVCVVAFFKLTGISGGKGIIVDFHALYIIIPIFIALILSAGVGLILSVLQVYFRDIEFIYDVLTQLLFYMVPIIYHISKINSLWIVVIIKINPLYSIIELFRQSVMYGMNPSLSMIAYSLVTSVLVLIIGIIIFEKHSDDLIYHL